MFKSIGVNRADLADLSAVEKMIRRRFDIDVSELVLVSENAGSKPGYPPLETNIVFWRSGERYRLKLFMSVAKVRMVDLPLAWLLPVLRDNGDADCC